MKQKSIDKKIMQISQTKIVFSTTAIVSLIVLAICSLLNVNKYILIGLLAFIFVLLCFVLGLAVYNYRTINYYCYHEHNRYNGIKTKQLGFSGK